MPRTVSKRRSRIAVFAVLATLATLVAVPAVPAAAATDSKVTNPALHAACPSGVAPASNFTDVSASSFAKADIDCIAYYGVTKGTSATTYSPAQNVTREQMALFLARSAGPAGVVLAASPADPGFSDDDSLSAESQLAIAQLFAAGVTKGTTTTTFSPKAPVTRVQMALFLQRFLDKAVAGPGGTLPKNATGGVVADRDNPFTDIGGVTFEANTAIRALYELGVTTGATATTFAPGAAVTREQMAAFVARSLNHANARPVGVNIQTSATDGFGDRTGVVAVTYRDTNFMPMANVLIDVFSQTYATSATTVSSPLNADGTCNLAVVVQTSGTAADECKIANVDFATNSNGNYVVGNVTTTNGNTNIWWAWTGAIGASFDVDTTPVSSIKVASTTAATTYTATASSTLIKFGTTATITLKTNTPQSGVDINVTEQRVQDGNTTTTTTKVTTAADGTATYTVAAFTDPSTTAANTATSTLSFSAVPAGFTNPANVVINVSDATSVATTVTAPADSYGVWAATASTSVGVTVKDQYGAVMANESVSFTINGGAAIVRTTNASGVATLSWTAPAATATDTIVATAGGSDTYLFHWADNVAADTVVAVAVAIQVWDDANDIIVAGNKIWKYDANDQFNAGGGAVDYAGFEAALKAGGAANDEVAVNYKVLASGVSVWTLS